MLRISLYRARALVFSDKLYVSHCVHLSLFYLESLKCTSSFSVVHFPKESNEIHKFSIGLEKQVRSGERRLKFYAHKIHKYTLAIALITKQTHGAERINKHWSNKYSHKFNN